jgi:hypothetical protein
LGHLGLTGKIDSSPSADSTGAVQPHVAQLFSEESGVRRQLQTATGQESRLTPWHPELWL